MAILVGFAQRGDTRRTDTAGCTGVIVDVAKHALPRIGRVTAADRDVGTARELRHTQENKRESEHHSVCGVSSGVTYIRIPRGNFAIYDLLGDWCPKYRLSGMKVCIRCVFHHIRVFSRSAGQIKTQNDDSGLGRSYLVFFATNMYINKNKIPRIDLDTVL